ncbi:hypothetical protein CDAR_314591 [Caerostris darwini]|uniref:Uncharacterized protein n=1 Tax=Caerostris darwini TaxID=1538125 RepID=A0AAV4TRD7_9ARAC|nr:hypothetical protein CDAR_314591 [Caerostris darwini]
MGRCEWAKRPRVGSAFQDLARNLPFLAGGECLMDIDSRKKKRSREGSAVQRVFVDNEAWREVLATRMLGQPWYWKGDADKRRTAPPPSIL